MVLAMKAFYFHPGKRGFNASWWRILSIEIICVVEYQKYITRLGELIRVEPWRNIYHFSQTKTALNTKPSINNSWYMIHDGDALNAFFCRARLNTFTRLPKPRPLQTESICRRQNKCDSKIEVCYGRSRKNCEKRRKCWLPAFSPFCSMISKAYYFMAVECRDCVLKS